MMRGVGKSYQSSEDAESVNGKDGSDCRCKKCNTSCEGRREDGFRCPQSRIFHPLGQGWLGNDSLQLILRLVEGVKEHENVVCPNTWRALS